MQLRVYLRESHIETLGPGVRFGLWVQGCQRACPGCISPTSRPLDGGQLIDTGALAWEVILSGAQGITISGGEPFLQAAALAEFVGKVREGRDLGTIVYTGYTIEELWGMASAESLLACTDLLIDGPYVQALDDGVGLRGSANQRLIALTERYAQDVATLEACPREREPHLHADGMSVVGIPNEHATGHHLGPPPRA